MQGMAVRPESRSSKTQVWRVAGGLLLGLAACTSAEAARAGAQVSATVLEAVHVNGLIGVPITAEDLLEAWEAAPGTNTGVMPLRLPSLLMPAEPATGPAFDAGATAALAGAEQGAGAEEGLLQPGLAAAISAVRYEAGEGHAAQLSITVAFN